MESVDKYLKVLHIQEELEQLNEANINSFFSKLAPEAKTKSLIQKMKISLKEKDPVNSIKRIKTLLNFLPVIKLKKIDKFANSKIDNFKRMKKMASVVLKNSVPTISKKANDYASSFLAISSLVAKKNDSKLKPEDNLKKHIKEFVLRVRKFGADYGDDTDDNSDSKIAGLSKEDLPDMAVAWTIVAMSTALAIGIGSGLFVVLGTISSLLPWIMILGFILAIVLGFLKFVMGGK